LVFIVCLAIIHNAEPQQPSAGDMCQMVADPHLTPFATPPGSTVTPAQQWCTQPGSQVLLQDQFVQISIDVDSPPSAVFYPIIGFTFTFAPSIGAACVIDDVCLNAGSCCAIPGVTIVTSPGPSWQVTYTTMLVVQITTWGGGPTYYNLNIWQDPSQRQYSSGLCVCGCPTGFLYGQGQPQGGKGKRHVSRDKRQINPACQQAVSQWIQQSQLSPSQAGQNNALTACTQDLQENSPYINAAVSDTLVMDVMRQASPSFSQAQYGFAHGGQMPPGN